MSSVGKIVFAEIRYRRWSALLSIVIVAASVAIVVFFMLLSELAAQRTQVIQRDIGLNMRIIPADTDMEAYWIRGYAEGLIDQSILQTATDQDVANRMVPMLQRTIQWGDGEAILTGVGEELFARRQAMKPVFGSIQSDAAGLTLGSVAAENRRLKEGEKVELLGRQFTIEKILSSTGSMDDIRVYGNLETVQDLLGLPDKLNEIRALECQCGSNVADPESYVQSILQPLLPGTIVVRQDQVADARRKQRQMVDRIGVVATPVMVALAALALLGLSLLNVQSRQSEIGLMSSVGQSSLRIGLIIWLRSAVLGLLGGFLGACLGWQIATHWGGVFVDANNITAQFQPARLLMGGAVGGIIAACGALVPAVLAAQSDPVTTLRGGR